MKLIYQTLLAGICLACASCASAPYPQQQLLQSKSALSAAEAVEESERDPGARLHLKLARDQIHEAELLLKDGDNGRAQRVLARAEADARLALAKARAGEMKRKGQAALNRVEELRTETH